MKKICISGLGYIGLPTASLLATKGFEVHGVDVNPQIVRALQRGDILIHEPSLDILVKSAVNSGNLRAATEPAEADVFIISVPTPFDADQKPDLSRVYSAVESLAPYLRPGNLVIVESTIPVGTTEKVAALLAGLRPDLGIAGRAGGSAASVCVAHCPERVLPGKILHELVENDRTVGGIDKASTDMAAEFYRTFVQGTVLTSTARTAEMVKLTENAFRDVNIAFANELSLLCGELGTDVWEVIRLANRHPRVNILRPGPGVGGHCIAVDPWFLVDSAPRTARLIRTAREVNNSKPETVLRKILDMSAAFSKPTIACLGLSFKPDIDDLRESPALHIVERLAEHAGLSLLVCEPYRKSLPDSLAGNPRVHKVELQEALERADVVAALVAHRPFCTADAACLRGKAVLDVCGIWQGKPGDKNL